MSTERKRRVKSLLPLLLSALLILGSQPILAPAAAASITTAACRDTFGTPGNVTISVTTDRCILTFTGNSTWTPAAGYSAIRFLLVGGGAAGRTDGGGGGGGGGGLAHPSLAITSGQMANVVVGAGGNADLQSNGGQSRLDTNNDGTFEWTANGGNVGGGWDTRVGGTAGSASVQSGANVLTGGNGGAGPASTASGTAAASGGSNGFTSDITGTTRTYGGGGGGGIGSHSNGVNAGDIAPANGGSGGGGAGASQRARGTTVTWNYLGVDGGSESLIAFCNSNLHVGTTVGFQGKAGFGGGGGGGSAYGDGCASGTNTLFDGERNRGGYGGSGVVIIRYIPDVTDPEITGPGSATGASSTISIAENSTAVHSFTANESVTWSRSGADNARFTLTGNVLTISARDFETPQSTLNSNTYVVVITATDASTNATSQTLSVTITNVNEAPTITTASSSSTHTISVAENTTAVITYTGSDVDAGTSLTWSISGTDASFFAINSSSGVLTFTSGRNFEVAADSGNNNTYIAIIALSDGALTDTQTLTVSITNVNEAPSISIASSSSTHAISVAENTTAVITYTGSDVDAGTSLTWSISGTDASFFAINSSSGVLTFTSGRNFEVAADAGANNIYDLVVTLSDGALTDTQTLTVTITNINEAPTITTASSSSTHAISVAENTTAVITYTGSDVDAGTSLTWSISGTDASFFAINSSSGVLTFTSARDFEAPADGGNNNSYIVIIALSDGSLTDTQTLTVTITNLNESGSLLAPTLSGTPAKGVAITASVDLNAAGSVRFFVNGKRIANCLARPTSGSGSTFTATCTWRPTFTGRQSLTATLTPASNTFSAATSPELSTFVVKRTTRR